MQSVLLLGMQKANDSYGDRKCVLENSWGFTRLKQRASDELQSQKSVQQTNLLSKTQTLTMILYRLVALSMSWHMQCMYFRLEKKIILSNLCLLPVIYFVPVKILKYCLGHFCWFFLSTIKHGWQFQSCSACNVWLISSLVAFGWKKKPCS